jgi:photosystem II stability/assembly factor-like uncharacterized protein
VEVLLSHDDGVTWARTPASPPEEFVGFTVDFAPGDGRTLYLSGFFDEEGHPGSLLRTKDAGAHWERLPIPGTDDARIPYIAGIPSNDPKTIFIRVDGYPMDSLLVTRDEGAHFTSSFESKASLFAFAISPDGQQAVVGGDRDGLWRTSLTNLTWEEGARINAWCARWDSGGLMACGNPLGDTFTLGRSEDQGKTFQPLLQFADISGPRTCPESSPVSKVCPGAWPALAPALGASLPDAGTKPQPIDAGETPAVDGGGPTATQAPTTASCRLPQRHPVGSALPVGLGLLAAFFARRQGRRSARPVQRHHEP